MKEHGDTIIITTFRYAGERAEVIGHAAGLGDIWVMVEGSHDVRFIRTGDYREVSPLGQLAEVAE